MKYLLYDIWLKLRLFHFPLKHWYNRVWKQDLDERVCCDGFMCGCGGGSYRQMMEWELRNVS